MSEQQFIRSTAPTLAGMKTGSLFPFHFSSRKQAISELRALNRRLQPKGLRLLPLRMTEQFAMLYLYRPDRLRRDLQEEECAALLREAGYPSTDACACLCELARRIRSQAEFPHEVGLFLGYPPEDVRGFMEHRCCKCVGCWKVYGDVDAAKRTFQAYQDCTNRFLRQHSGGCTLEALTV